MRQVASERRKLSLIADYERVYAVRVNDVFVDSLRSFGRSVGRSTERLRKGNA
jgi:hypothetical protein